MITMLQCDFTLLHKRIIWLITKKAWKIDYAINWIRLYLIAKAVQVEKCKLRFLYEGAFIVSVSCFLPVMYLRKQCY